MITRTPTRRILTVCLGNHCRSPLAAAVLAARAGHGREVRSAGLVDKWVGKPAHPHMITVAARYGYDLTNHRGAQVTADLLRWADLVLAMDQTNLTALRNLTGSGTADKLALYLGNRDVPDPWGKPEPVFAACLELIESGARFHLP